MAYLCKVFILIFILLFCSGAAAPDKTAVISVNKPETEKAEKLFKAVIPVKEGIIYTKVPRGLIISIDEKYFFTRGSIKIRESSLVTLNAIISVYQNLDNFCVIECHSDPDGVSDSDYQSNWGLTLARASNIVLYFIRYGNIKPDKIFGIGFGEFMPFKDNVSPNGNLDNRIDFVFIDYEAKR